MTVVVRIERLHGWYERTRRMIERVCTLIERLDTVLEQLIEQYDRLYGLMSETQQPSPTY